MSDLSTPTRSVGRVLLVGFVTVAAAATLVTPTWLALNQRDATKTVSAAFVPPAATLGQPPVKASTGPVSRGALPTTAPRAAVKTQAPSTATVSALAADHWSPLPKAPIAGRDDAAVAWTGSQMLVWGGVSGARNETVHRDGAAYDPASKTWTMLPPSPLSARTSAASVWTGSALFIWGGATAFGVYPKAASDGALYNPSTRSWRTLPAAPLSAREGAHAVVVRGIVYVIGGYPAAGANSEDLDAASYDPVTNSWTRLPAMPTSADHPIQSVVESASDTTVFVWRRWEHTTNLANGGLEVAAGIDAVTFDPSTATWSGDPGAAAGDNRSAPVGIDQALWTGARFVVPSAWWCGGCAGPPPHGTFGFVLGVDPTAWTPMAHGPIDDDFPSYVWTGAALLGYQSAGFGSGPNNTDLAGSMAAWNPETNAWTSLPNVPLAGNGDIATVWTGSELLEWGPMFEAAGHDGSVTPAYHDAGLSFGP